MKALVTGSAGFIGAHLARRLRHEGASVRLFTRAEGDIRDFSVISKAAAGCDTVFHLAGKAHAVSELNADDREYHSINFEGTQNVWKAAVEAGVSRFVFFSSVKAMGEKAEICLDESFKPDPQTPYGRSKRMAEQFLMDASGSCRAVCLRLPMVYGVGNKGNLFRMMEAVDRGIFPPVPEFGNKRSMAHVLNVVEGAYLAATHTKAAGIYIITDSQPYSTRELYEWIAEALDKRIPSWRISKTALSLMAKTGDAIGKLRGRRFIFDTDALMKLKESAWYSSQKAGREIGYQARLDFPGSVRSLVAWYREARA